MLYILKIAFLTIILIFCLPIQAMLQKKSHKRKATQELFAALKNKNILPVILAVEKGADINAFNQFKDAPLHLAVYPGTLQMIQFLLEKNANIDIQDKEGWTPLQDAIMFDKTEAAKFLLDKGADFELLCGSEESSENLAEANNPEIFDCIQDKRKQIQKRFSTQLTTIIHHTYYFKERGVAHIIAEYFQPDLQDCGMDMQNKLDALAARP